MYGDKYRIWNISSYSSYESLCCCLAAFAANNLRCGRLGKPMSSTINDCNQLSTTVINCHWKSFGVIGTGHCHHDHHDRHHQLPISHTSHCTLYTYLTLSFIFAFSGIDTARDKWGGLSSHRNYSGAMSSDRVQQPYADFVANMHASDNTVLPALGHKYE